MQHYVQALCREIAERRHELPHTRVRTIYIGGGTPSLLSPTLLQQIFDAVYANYDVEDGAEVTLEMNPDDLDPPPAPPVREGSWLRKVNRVSLGIQTFNDQLLHLIRRRHDSQTAIQAVRRLQADGIRNISIDLIYGLPGQPLAQWEPPFAVLTWHECPNLNSEIVENLILVVEKISIKSRPRVRIKIV